MRSNQGRALGLAVLCLTGAACADHDGAAANGTTPQAATPASAPVDVRIMAADAERLDLHDPASPLAVTWTTEPANAPVDVLIGSTPGAAPSAMTRVAEGVTSGRWQGAHDGRAHVLLRPASGNAVRVAARVLPLEGGRNFRDLGGYVTEDGRRLKWGSVFRSGVMDGFTDADQAFIDDLDARVIIDFRSVEERSAEPTSWRPDDPVFWSREYSSADQESELMAGFASGEITAEQSRARMTALYRRLPDEHAHAYREMFDRLAAGDTPLVFHCSAGKDRTGVAAALLLTALGVPRATVIEDYALSDDVVDFAAEFGARAASGTETDDGPYAMLRQLPRDALMPLMASDPAYIRAAFEDIERQHGSVRAFLRDVLDVSDAELAAIRERLLES